MKIIISTFGGGILGSILPVIIGNLLGLVAWAGALLGTEHVLFELVLWAERCIPMFYR